MITNLLHLWTQNKTEVYVATVRVRSGCEICTQMTLISTENYYKIFLLLCTEGIRTLLISGQLYPRTSGWVSQLPAYNERILVVPSGAFIL